MNALVTVVRRLIMLVGPKGLKSLSGADLVFVQQYRTVIVEIVSVVRLLAVSTHLQARSADP